MPKATDDQTRTAQQMMMVMTVMMGVLFFKVPAGLCIYFITSSTWSLIERFLIKKYTPQAEIKTLPDNIVNEIMNAVSKPSAAGVRAATSAAPASDKPKSKPTKPPETLAELFEPFFKKKKEPQDSDSGTKNPNAPTRSDKRNSGSNKRKRP